MIIYSRLSWEGDDQPNLLAVLTLAWSYILSARRVELQGSDVSIVTYTYIAVPIYPGDNNPWSISVDIGGVDSRTVRWFAAILAPGVGFLIALGSHYGPLAYSLAMHASTMQFVALNAVQEQRKAASMIVRDRVEIYASQNGKSYCSTSLYHVITSPGN